VDRVVGIQGAIQGAGQKYVVCTALSAPGRRADPWRYEGRADTDWLWLLGDPGRDTCRQTSSL
jgi:hypothetical protein